MMFRQRGGITLQELSLTPNVDQDDTREIIKKLLQKGQILQDTSQEPARFHAKS